MKVIFGFILLVLAPLAYAQTQALERADPLNLPQGIRFDVDKVQLPENRMNEMGAQKVFENSLEKKIRFFPNELANQKVISGWNNCFVAAIHTSFAEHRPLTLSPDAIWLTICQGVSIHINAHFDELESVIFKADKPDKIVVRNDDLVKGSEQWVELLHAFSDSTTKYVNDDYYAFFVPEFSTTTNIIRTSYEVTMLEGFSQAFEYIGDSGCGIPYITLQGAEEDWIGIYDRIDKIEALGMGVWANELRGVVQKFIDAYHSKIDLPFWQSIYKDHTEYGGSYVSGWFIKFFPYLERNGKIEEVINEEGYPAFRAGKEYYLNEYLEGNRYLVSRLTTGDFPSGMAVIDVLWQNFGNNEQMKVHAGFYGIKQYDDLSLEPAIAWAVVSEDAEEVQHKENRNWTYPEHRKVYWSPNVKGDIIDSAVYNQGRFKSAEDSYHFVKEHILSVLEKSTQLNVKDLEGISVQLIVLTNGEVLECRSEQLDATMLMEITRIVQSLPKKWTPGTVDFRHFEYDYDDENDSGEIVPVPTHSSVKIDF